MTFSKPSPTIAIHLRLHYKGIILYKNSRTKDGYVMIFVKFGLTMGMFLYFVKRGHHKGYAFIKRGPTKGIFS